MRSYRSIAILVAFFLASYSSPAQGPPNGFPPSSRITSQKGQPGQDDIVGHKHVAKGARLKCLIVEHHPKHGDDGAACVLKFQEGEPKSIAFGEETVAPRDGEVHLTCAGDQPTRCVVGIW